MQNLIFGQINIDTEKLIEDIVERLAQKLSADRGDTKLNSESPSNPLDEYIPKKDVRGQLASSSTLWKYEKEGKITAYGIGGKRYYKREDIERLFKPIKTTETTIDSSPKQKMLNNGK